MGAKIRVMFWKIPLAAVWGMDVRKDKQKGGSQVKAVAFLRVRDDYGNLDQHGDSEGRGADRFWRVQSIGLGDQLI